LEPACISYGFDPIHGLLLHRNGTVGAGDGLPPILQSSITTYSNNTVEQCLNACTAAGYLYAGLSGTVCSCGNKLIADTQSCGTGVGCVSRAKPESECNTPCPGNSGQVCGGGWRVSIHALDSLIYLGCFSDGNGPGQGDGKPRALPVKLWSNVMTNSPEACMTACFNAGYLYAGTEVGHECYCGDAIRSNGGAENRRLVVLPSSLLASPYDSCSTPCSGNPVESCGGSWRMSVYTLPAGLPASTAIQRECYWKILVHTTHGFFQTPTRAATPTGMVLGTEMACVDCPPDVSTTKGWRIRWRIAWWAATTTVSPTQVGEENGVKCKINMSILSLGLRSGGWE